MTAHKPQLSATLATLFALYVAQGLPSGLFAHALPVFWREAGVALGWIGALKLLALPWVLKVFWAPFIDRSLQAGSSPLRWIARLQLPAAGLLLAIAWLGLAPASEGLLAIVALVLAINLLMASQDVVTDGLAVRWVPASWKGLANSLQVAGYKLGMLAGGALLLILAEPIGVRMALLLPVTLLVLLFIIIRPFRPLRHPLRQQGEPQTATPATLSAGGQLSLRDGFLGLIRQPGMPFWLAVVACYKVADALGSGMIRPMLTDHHWSPGDIGTFTLISTLAGLVGAVLGGWLHHRLGGRRSLMLAGTAQALTLAAWALIPLVGATGPMVYGVGLGEQLADGASTVVLFAMMMTLCRQSWAGTDFTLQASIQVVFAGLFGLAGGVIAQAWNYTSLFIAAGAAGLIVLAVFQLYGPKNALTPPRR